MSQIRQAHARMLTVDGHIDADLYLTKLGWNIGERHRSQKVGGSKIDLPRMKEGGLDAAFFFVPVHQGNSTPEGYANARDAALLAIARIRRLAEDHSGLLGLGSSPEDAYRLEKEGKHTAFIGLANGYALGTDLSLIADFYARGVRCLTLCGGVDNAICDSAADQGHPEDRGLSDFGRQVVLECNRVGMIIDVAGCSEKSFFDVLAVSHAPVIASHSAARALCDLPANLSDEMIHALAKKGGVVQLCFVPAHLAPSNKAGGAKVQDIADHVDYITRLAGVDSIGIGSGFDGGGGVPGCNDVSEILNITLELLRRGHGEHAIEDIWGGNIMRVFKQVSSVAGMR